VRLYNDLFVKENPEEQGADFKDNLNPDSLEILPACKVEPSLKDASVSGRYQFLRRGYFCVDPDTTEEKLVFNRIVSLKDTWAKMQKNK